MALFECPDCGRNVSDKAVACPGCGRPVNIAGQSSGHPNQHPQPPSRQPVLAPPKQKPENIGSKQFSSLYLLGIMGVLLILCAICGEATQKGDTPKTEKATGAVSSQKNYIKESCAKVSSAFGLHSKATELQKENAWKQYEGRWVKWTGRVSAVDKTFGFGKLYLQVKCLNSPFLTDAVIFFDDEWENKLLKLKQGQSVTFEARLNNTGSILGLSLNEGKILKP